MNKTATLYDYCKRLVLLYEMEANLYELGYARTTELRDSIVSEILDTEEQLRSRIKKDEI